MSESDITKLLMLLAELYPNYRQSVTRATRAAWALCLEPYTYEQVKSAALAHSRDSAKGRYYPTAPDLASRIATDESAGSSKSSGDENKNAWMDAILSKQPEIPTCELLHRHPGIVGEIMRLHYPDAALCGEDHCPVWAFHGECPHQKTGGENEPKLECRGAGE